MGNDTHRKTSGVPSPACRSLSAGRRAPPSTAYRASLDVRWVAKFANGARANLPDAEFDAWWQALKTSIRGTAALSPRQQYKLAIGSKVP
jgi:hypothetical protein